MLNEEKDIEHMISNLRILKFLQKSQLKKRQRDIVQYFMRYVIENSEIKQEEQEGRQSTANQLVEDFQPKVDIYDRRILFEIAKRRVDLKDYQDDSSFSDEMSDEEPDDNQNDNQLINRDRRRKSKVEELLGDYAVIDEDRHRQMSKPGPKNEQAQDSGSDSDSGGNSNYLV